MGVKFSKLKRAEWAFLIGMFIYSAIPLLGGLVRVTELTFGLSIMPQNPRAIALPMPIVIHILTSFVYCFFGSFQFVKSIRKMSPLGHQLLGKAVVMCGLISAVTGVWMTAFFEFPAELQGTSLYWTRWVLGSLMVIFILWAMLLLKRRRLPAHGQYMIRAYAIGQGASTQAIFGILWPLVIGGEIQGTKRDILMIGSWIFNMVVAEWIIRKIYFNRSTT